MEETPQPQEEQTPASSPLPNERARFPAGWILLVIILALFIANGLQEWKQAAPDSLKTLQDQFEHVMVKAPSFAKASIVDRILDDSQTASEPEAPLFRMTLRATSAVLAQKTAASFGGSLNTPGFQKDSAYDSDVKAIGKFKGGDEALGTLLTHIVEETSPTHGKDKNPNLFTKEAVTQDLADVQADTFTKQTAEAVIQDRLLGNPAPLQKLRDSHAPLGFAIGAAVYYITCLISGFILLIAYLYARSKNSLPPLKHPADVSTLFKADRYALHSFLLFAAFFLISLLPLAIPGLVSASHTKGSSNIGLALGVSAVIELATVIAVIVLAGVKILGIKVSLRQMGLTAERLKKTIFWGLGGFCVALFCEACLAFVGSSIAGGTAPHPLTKDLGSDSGSFFAIFCGLLAASILAPIFEEILFRGCLTPALEKVFGDGPRALFWAIVVSSFLFAAGHPTGPGTWMALGIIGVVHCVLTYQTKSVWPGIISHALFNTSQLVLTIALARIGFF